MLFDFDCQSGELTLSSPVAASYFLNAANKTILGDTPALQVTFNPLLGDTLQV